MAVPGVCTGRQADVPDGPRRHERVLKMLVPPGASQQFAVHHGCICNEIASIYGRVRMSVPRPQRLALLRLRILVGKLAGRQVLRELSREDVLTKFVGSRRKRYSRAADLLDARGWSDQYARVSMFVKVEKFDPTSKDNPIPRAIQFRGYMCGLELARYLKPYEHRFYNTIPQTTVTRTRVMGKGLSGGARARLFMDKWSAFKHPWVVALDAIKFDAHVNTGLLSVEHMYYKLINRDPFFAHLLHLQTFNKCRSQNGYKYTVRGGRMSGDMNTALGNCLLMYIMLLDAMRGVEKWDCLIDGDDCLLFTEGPPDCSAIKREFLNYGMELKLESPSDDYHDIVWCQSKLVEISGLHRWVLNPIRVLNKGLGNTKYMSTTKEIKAYAGSVGVGYFAMFHGVPILQEYSLALIRISEGRLMNLDDRFFWRAVVELGSRKESVVETLRSVPIVPEIIGWDTRVDFMRTFGIDMGEQYRLESELRAWQPNLTFTSLEEAAVVAGVLSASWIVRQRL